MTVKRDENFYQILKKMKKNYLKIADKQIKNTRKKNLLRKFSTIIFKTFASQSD